MAVSVELPQHFFLGNGCNESENVTFRECHAENQRRPCSSSLGSTLVWKESSDVWPSPIFVPLSKDEESFDLDCSDDDFRQLQGLLDTTSSQQSEMSQPFGSSSDCSQPSRGNCIPAHGSNGENTLQNENTNTLDDTPVDWDAVFGYADFSTDVHQLLEDTVQTLPCAAQNAQKLTFESANAPWLDLLLDERTINHDDSNVHGEERRLQVGEGESVFLSVDELLNVGEGCLSNEIVSSRAGEDNAKDEAIHMYGVEQTMSLNGLHTSSSVKDVDGAVNRHAEDAITTSCDPLEKQVLAKMQSLAEVLPAEETMTGQCKRRRGAWERQKIAQRKKRTVSTGAEQCHARTPLAVCRSLSPAEQATEISVREEGAVIRSERGPIEVLRTELDAAGMQAEAASGAPQQTLEKPNCRNPQMEDSSGDSSGEASRGQSPQQGPGMAKACKLKCKASSAERQSEDWATTSEALRVAGGHSDCRHSSEFGNSGSASSPAASSHQGTQSHKAGGLAAENAAVGSCQEVTGGGGASGDDDTAKRLQRLIRNRASASDSRQRKKSYVYELEGKCAALEAQLGSLRQLASITAMENGVLRDQLTRFQHFYGHPAGIAPSAVGGGPALANVPDAEQHSLDKPGARGCPTATLGQGTAADHAPKEQQEESSKVGSAKRRSKSNDKAEPAALESDSLPSESLPRHSFPSLLVALYCLLLLSFLSAPSHGLCLLHACLFLPLRHVLVNAGGEPQVLSRSGEGSWTGDSKQRLLLVGSLASKRSKKSQRTQGPFRLWKVLLSWIRRNWASGKVGWGRKDRNRKADLIVGILLS